MLLREDDGGGASTAAGYGQLSLAVLQKASDLAFATVAGDEVARGRGEHVSASIATEGEALPTAGEPLREQIDRVAAKLGGLSNDLRAVDGQLSELAPKREQFDLVQNVCDSLERLRALGVSSIDLLGREGERDARPGVASTRFAAAGQVHGPNQGHRGQASGAAQRHPAGAPSSPPPRRRPLRGSRKRTSANANRRRPRDRYARRSPAAHAMAAGRRRRRALSPGRLRHVVDCAVRRRAAAPDSVAAPEPEERWSCPSASWSSSSSGPRARCRLRQSRSNRSPKSPSRRRSPCSPTSKHPSRRRRSRRRRQCPSPRRGELAEAAGLLAFRDSLTEIAERRPAAQMGAAARVGNAGAGDNRLPHAVVGHVARARLERRHQSRARSAARSAATTAVAAVRWRRESGREGGVIGGGSGPAVAADRSSGRRRRGPHGRRDSDRVRSLQGVAVSALQPRAAQHSDAARPDGAAAHDRAERHRLVARAAIDGHERARISSRRCSSACARSTSARRTLRRSRSSIRSTFCPRHERGRGNGVPMSAAETECR